MYKIRLMISVWCVVFLSSAVVCAQLEAIDTFYSEMNHHGTHIESQNPSDNDVEETKHNSIIPVCFDFSPFFEPTLVAFSCGQLVFQHLSVSRSVFPAEFCGRAPPA
jgi:hypothetical protein